MMDYKGKVLNLQEEKQAWEFERSGLISQISVLNTNRREELMSQPLIHNEDQMNQPLAEELLVAMLQINLREGRIKGIKEENRRLKQEVAQKNEEKNKILNERKQLQKKASE